MIDGVMSLVFVPSAGTLSNSPQDCSALPRPTHDHTLTPPPLSLSLSFSTLPSVNNHSEENLQGRAYVIDRDTPQGQPDNSTTYTGLNEIPPTLLFSASASQQTVEWSFPLPDPTHTHTPDFHQGHPLLTSTSSRSQC